MQWYDYIRIGTALLAIVAAHRLGRLVIKDYKTYSTRLAEFVWILFAVFFTLFAAAIEAILSANGYRYGSILSFLIALAAVRATRADTGPLQRWSKPTDYTACGYSIMLNDSFVGYCDKEVITKNNIRQHIDDRPLHHISLIYNDRHRIAQV